MSSLGRDPGNHPTWRSRARNWIYRKNVEPSPGAWSSHFRYLAALHAREPRVLDALHAPPDLHGQLALFEFHEPELRIYSGREFIVFDERRYLYYRMPGAKPNGKGEVPDRLYRVRVVGLGDSRPLFLDLEKRAPASFTLRASTVTPPAAVAAYAPLDASELDYSWIITEIHDLIVRWLSFHVAAIDTGMGLPGPEAAEELRRLVARRPRIDDRTETAAAKLLVRLDRLSRP